MSKALSYQFIPVPTELKKGIRSLKGNFYRVMDLIIDEIFAFVDTREKLTKEFAYRYVANKLEINFGNVGRIFRVLQARGFIELLKIGKNKTGSLIRLIFGCTGTTNESPLGCTGTTNEDSFSCTGTTIKEIQYKEKDQKSEISDSDSLNLDSNEEKLEITFESSFDDNSDSYSLLPSSEENNLNNLAINLLPPAGPGSTAAGNNEFTALGSVLTAVISAPSPVPILPAPVPQVADPPIIITPSVIEEGKKVLASKGFGPEEVKNIVIRMTGSMTGKDINNLNGYFISACKKEVKKSSNSAGSVHKSTGADLSQGTAPLHVQKKNSFTDTVNQWEKRQLEEENFEEILKDLMKTHPQEIYIAIQKIDNSPETKWIPSISSIRAVYYVKEFRKMFSEV